MKTPLTSLHNSDWYQPNDPNILVEQSKYQELLYVYNKTKPSEKVKRSALLQRLFDNIGDDVTIEPPFYANWGGHFCSFGNHIYANHGLTLVDDTTITVGDYTMFGPHVTIATARHPLDSHLRKQGLQQNLPVNIGQNCWLGANVTILPGVTIGNNVVIGAGSLVTKSLPDNVLAYGSPARVVKKLS